jgi:hypothetical protein
LINGQVLLVSSQLCSYEARGCSKGSTRHWRKYTSIAPLFISYQLTSISVAPIAHSPLDRRGRKGDTDKRGLRHLREISPDTSLSVSQILCRRSEGRECLLCLPRIQQVSAPSPRKKANQIHKPSFTLHAGFRRIPQKISLPPSSTAVLCAPVDNSCKRDPE